MTEAATEMRSVVIEREYAAVLAARAVDGQSGRSIHYSLLAQ